MSESDKTSKEPNALSGFCSIETLSQSIYFFNHFHLFFVVSDFDIPEAVSCSSNAMT